MSKFKTVGTKSHTKQYSILYKRVSGSQFETSRTVDASVYTDTIEASTAKAAEKMLQEKQSTAGLGRKITIIRTIVIK